MKFLFLLSFLFVQAVWGGDISVQIEVDNNNVTTQDQIELQVHVHGTQSASEPQIMGSDNFLVEQAGTSSQIQMINGTTTITKTFQFIFSPKREGEFTVGPAIVDVDGTEYKSESIIIKVSKDTDQTTSRAAENKNLFVEAVVDKLTPFVNEQFIYTFRFFTQVGIANANLDLPEFKGFWKEPLGEQKKYIKNINGVQWQVLELSFLLTALRPGKVTIEEARLIGEITVEGTGRRNGRSLIDQFFGGRYAERKRVQLITRPLNIDVRDLPGDRPDGFSGLVGNFTIEAQSDKDTLKMGESVTMTVRLSGYGALENATLASQETDEFKFYDDKPVSNKNLDSEGVISTKIFKRAIVPKKAGNLTFPPVKLIVFNPTTKVYQTIQSGSFTLNVLPGDKDDINHTAYHPTSAKKSIEVLGQDLMPIRYGLDSLSNTPLSRTQRLGLMLIILGLPLIYGALHVVTARQLLFKGNISLVRKTKAAKEFLAGHKTLMNSSTFVEDALNLLKDYLGNKLNLDGRSITQFDIERILVPYQVSASTLTLTKEIFDMIEKSQYGGLTLTGEDKNKICKKIRTLFDKYEKEMKS
ncbi:MAG: protein BatD [Bdellovibrio sp.]|nr:protein BatD [Bdellovibrio sp.]